MKSHLPEVLDRIIENLKGRVFKILIIFMSKLSQK